jgi:hypothetical protein
VRVLITNDDGIQATGLNALRRELREVPGSTCASSPERQPEHRAQHHDPLAALGGGDQFDDRSVGYSTEDPG